MRMRVRQSDVLALVVLVLLGGTFSLAQINRAEETANRVRCASNLRQIGQALLLDSNENRAPFPRPTPDPDKPTPTWGTPYEGNAKLGPLPADRAQPFSTKK